MNRSRLRAGSVLLAGAITFSGCAATAQGSRPTNGPASPQLAPARLLGTPVMVPLDVAERQARDLGPIPAHQSLSLDLSLRRRSSARLDALLAKGGRLTPAQWAASYGPATRAVAATRKILAGSGISSQWQPGEVSLTATAGAGVIERFFHVRIDDFAMRNGTRFYGPWGQPATPAAIAGEVTAVSGMDDYPDDMTAAIQGADGVTPAQMTSFYDLSPLRSAGIDGSGVTVMFPEWAVPDSAVLSAFTRKFNLPQFNIDVVQDPSKWGAPATAGSQQYSAEASEAALDLEVVHGLAPGAKEVVYEGGDPSDLPAMLEAMVTAHPGAILSSSVFSVSCEQSPGAKQAADISDAVFAQAASEGTSVFWAAGDRGAFPCISDGKASTAQTVSVEPQGASPHITAVGGTTVFLASNGAYYKEAAWGEPVEQWGGGGGYSTIFSRPSWQTGPGLSGTSGRGVPDVSANADIESGWDVFTPGQSGPQEGPVGGTSAATPCWAAITALIDQYLMQQHLKTVGFANPALYYFARSPQGLPAPAFHEITEGSNLHYPATSGWNPATGLGSPDVAHLADDFAWFDRVHGGSV
jgi:subtilase family serine protease